MAAQSKSPTDYSWETEFAPRIGRGYILTVAGIFTLYMILMIFIAFHRWFGALQ